MWHLRTSELDLGDREIFYTLAEAKISLEAGRPHYNIIGPHSSLSYCPLASASAHRQQAMLH